MYVKIFIKYLSPYKWRTPYVVRCAPHIRSICVVSCHLRLFFSWEISKMISIYDERLGSRLDFDEINIFDEDDVG